MKILWVATKAPWPAEDGGRLLMLGTLEGLAERGHDVTLVAPAGDDPGGEARALARFCSPVLVPCRSRSLMADALRARALGRPTTLVRHTRDEVQRLVRAELERRPPDLVHLEQLQAFGLLGEEPVEVPVVLRAQNVESDLWEGAAKSSAWRGRVLAGEVRRLREWEARWLGRCDAVVALTREDASRLGELAPQVGIDVVTAPFPARLPAGEARSGNPCVLLLANRSWLPNRQGAEGFLREAWGGVRKILPGATLHVFGLKDEGEVARVGDGVVFHAAPEESRDAFAANGILVVPLEVASGLRMKILEAWARGLPVVASPAAARGLGATAGRELLVASDGSDFARSIQRLHREDDFRRRMVVSAERRLESVHRQDDVIRELEAVYRRVLTR